MGAGPLAGRAYVRREFEGVAQVFVPGAEGRAAIIPPAGDR